MYIHTSIDGPVGWFQFGAVVNKAAVSLYVQQVF